MSQALKMPEAEPFAPSPEPRLDPGEHLAAVSRVIRHLKLNLNRKHSLQDLAGIAGCSIWHFDRVFLRVTGMTPMAYLSALRLEAAKRLLVTSDARIIDICFEVGYNSLGSFGKRFTRMIGLSPRELRTQTAYFDPAMLRQALLMASAEPPPVDGVSVDVVGVADDARPLLVFVGLFSGGVPSLYPASCALRLGFGRVGIRRPKPGRYRAFGLAIPLEADSEDVILQDCSLRGESRDFAVGVRSALPDLLVRLQEPHPVSPPLLPILPLMLQRQMQGGLPSAKPPAAAHAQTTAHDAPSIVSG